MKSDKTTPGANLRRWNLLFFSGKKRFLKTFGTKSSKKSPAAPLNALGGGHLKKQGRIFSPDNTDSLGGVPYPFPEHPLPWRLVGGPTLNFGYRAP